MERWEENSPSPLRAGAYARECGAICRAPANRRHSSRPKRRMAPVGAAGIEPATACVQRYASMQAGCHTRPAISFAALHIVAQKRPGRNHKPDPFYVRVGRADEARGELRVLGRCTGRPTAGLASCYCKLLLLPVLQLTLLSRASLAAPLPRDLSAPIIHFALLSGRVAALNSFRCSVVCRL